MINPKPLLSPPQLFKHKLLLLAILLCVFAGVTAWTPYPCKLMPQFCLGVLFAHSVELLHEINHRRQFANDGVNRFVALLLGLPMLVSASRYKFLHGLHHKYVGTEKDTESFSYSYEQIATVDGFIVHLLMINHYLDVFKNMIASVFDRLKLRDDMPLQTKAHIRHEFRVMTIYLLSILSLTIFFQTGLFVDLWLIPLIIGASPAHALIELPEHLGCENQTTNIFKNTRSIRASRFAEWLTNGNCFHVAHHLNAGWEISKLRELHNQIEPQIEYLETSYPAYYMGIFKKILQKSFPMTQSPQ